MNARLAAVFAALAAVAISAGSLVAAHGQERGRALERLDDVRRACAEAEAEGRRVLHVISVGRGSFTFGSYEAEEGFLAIDTRHNLRALGGSVELLPARMEPVGFVVGPERASTIRAHASEMSLRVGFFLGFDNASRTLCILRPAAGVTIVRMDVAFLELVDRRGRVIARDDTDRLRAWLDDAEQDAVPGSGPRGALLSASRSDGTGITPDSWQRAIASATEGPVGRVLRACHEAGIARGALDGEVVVRAVVDGRTGSVLSTEVELSSIGDDEEATCVARAVSRLVLPPEPATGPRAMLSVPVRLRR